jgi:hypothetical protein
VPDPGTGLAWLSDPSFSFVGLATPCKCIVDQDTVHCRHTQWIFQALKAWDGANIVFSHEIKLSFSSLFEKIEALVMGVFQYFS